MQMTSTLWAYERYMQAHKTSLFEGIPLSDKIDAENLINTILLDAGEFETLYTNADFLKQAINIWFTRKYKAFDKMATALDVDYNPLENYDRNEEWTDNTKHETDRTGKNTDTAEGKNTETRNLSSKSSNTETRDLKDETNGGNTVGAVTSTGENEVSAFNTSGYSPHDKSTNSTGEQVNSSNNTTTSTGTDKNEANASDTGTVTYGIDTENVHNIQEKDKGTIDLIHSGRTHGNIGVTTSQQMLESEYTLRVKLDLIKTISDLFISDFCIMVY